MISYNSHGVPCVIVSILGCPVQQHGARPCVWLDNRPPPSFPERSPCPRQKLCPQQILTPLPLPGPRLPLPTVSPWESVCGRGPWDVPSGRVCVCRKLLFFRVVSPFLQHPGGSIHAGLQERGALLWEGRTVGTSTPNGDVSLLVCLCLSVCVCVSLPFSLLLCPLIPVQIQPPLAARATCCPFSPPTCHTRLCLLQPLPTSKRTHSDQQGRPVLL